ncbi:MAG: hypothetical protein K8J31_20720, partial [Anaerolineae bacterium]|nr:hypothetical protein [Anaerolineae bacterium]
VPLLAHRADTHPGLVLREMNITRDNPDRVKQAAWPRGGGLPADVSFIRVDAPELILSAVYRSGDDLIVRVYNVTRQPVSGMITFGLPIEQAQRVNLAETAQEMLPLEGSQRVPIQVRGGEIFTLKVRPARGG